jgi:hypothetical protein
MPSPPRGDVAAVAAPQPLRRLVPRAPTARLDLAARLLRADPADRPDARAVLAHSWTAQG